MQPTYRGLESSSPNIPIETSVKFPMVYRGQRPEAKEAQTAEVAPEPEASCEMPASDTHDQNQNWFSPMSQLVHAFCQGNWGFLDRWLARQFYRLSRWFRQQRF